MSEFEREDRYIVVKLKKLTHMQDKHLRACLFGEGIETVESVVVEHDWPEYNLVWAMIEHRMAGKPVPDFNLWRRANELQERLNAADQLIDDFSRACKWTREEDSGIWTSACGATWSFSDDGPTENGMNFCHCCGMRLVVDVSDVESEPIDDWHMNPCKQGHRDVGADGGVAHCYTCGEEITAATTQEAFDQWNATHASFDEALQAKP
ncbi:MAG: hypothetical protein ACRER3_01365 [Pseudomonas fluorescens]